MNISGNAYQAVAIILFLTIRYIFIFASEKKHYENKYLESF